MFTKDFLKTLILLILSLSLAACAPSTPQATAEPAPTADPVVVGREAFVRVCAECHGENGEGYANELAAPALDASEHAWHHADQQICEWIINGKLGIGREMPALKDQINPEEVNAVIAYLHTLWTPDQLAAQQDITARWPNSLIRDCSS